MVTVGGVDIGSNTARLLVARVTADGRLTSLEAHQLITRLGQGMYRSSMLLPAAIDRVSQALADFQRRCATFRLDALSVVATSAVREARNREDFVRRVREETGFSVEVLSGEEETRRVCLGVVQGLRQRGGIVPEDYLLVDLGGGSTEFAWCHRGRVTASVSSPLGVVWLTEKREEVMFA